MARIGYARVSTIDQHPEAQLAALEGAGCEETFTDHGISGAKASRPQLDKCLAYLRPGDELVVWKLDRLGRSVSNLGHVVGQLRERDVGFVSLTEDSTPPRRPAVYCSTSSPRLPRWSAS
jgi:DNA invertase Pin-like site-specific DNA recombinase